MRPQPLIAVTDVERSSGWYQSLLGCQSAHGGAQSGVEHPEIFSATVCAIVEHGGALLMVRQLNREGEERWNFPTGWMHPLDEDGGVQLPEHVVNRNLLMETGYAASQATLIGVCLVR